MKTRNEIESKIKLKLSDWKKFSKGNYTMANDPTIEIAARPFGPICIKPESSELYLDKKIVPLADFDEKDLGFIYNRISSHLSLSKRMVMEQFFSTGEI